MELISASIKVVKSYHLSILQSGCDQSAYGCLNVEIFSSSFYQNLLSQLVFDCHVFGIEGDSSIEAPPFALLVEKGVASVVGKTLDLLSCANLVSRYCHIYCLSCGAYVYVHVFHVYYVFSQVFYFPG